MHQTVVTAVHHDELTAERVIGPKLLGPITVVAIGWRAAPRCNDGQISAPASFGFISFSHGVVEHDADSSVPSNRTIQPLH
jgi:hypothetical protein